MISALLPPWGWAVMGAILGAILGSFLATIVVRWPKRESVMSGRSQCDGCGRALRALDLVPLVSALVLRGRCRACGAPIDPRHGAIEAMAALIGGVALFVVPGPAGLAWAAFGWGLLPLAVLDAEHFWLPDALTLPLLALGLAVGQGAALPDRAIGAAAGFGSLWLVGFAYRRLRGRDGLGGGDAKLLSAIGAWLGWQALPFVLLVASLVGLLAVAISSLRGRAVTRTSAFPFGSALCIGSLPAWLLAHVLLGR